MGEILGSVHTFNKGTKDSPLLTLCLKIWGIFSLSSECLLKFPIPSLTRNGDYTKCSCWPLCNHCLFVCFLVGPKQLILTSGFSFSFCPFSLNTGKVFVVDRPFAIKFLLVYSFRILELLRMWHLASCFWLEFFKKTH